MLLDLTSSPDGEGHRFLPQSICHLSLQTDVFGVDGKILPHYGLVTGSKEGMRLYQAVD